MRSPLLSDDGWPRSTETADLARRIDAVSWFERSAFTRDPTRRIAHAIALHAQRLGVGAPDAVTAISPEAGRDRLREGRIDLARPAWDAALRSPFERMRGALMQTQRAPGHPLILPSGDALLMRPEALPLSEDTLWERLQGPRADRLGEVTIRVLIDRILWELGMMVLWEVVGDILGPNPYEPLLVIYEEGLYPLEVSAEHATLWAPA